MPWAPGQSGNPRGGRPESIEVREVRRLAQAMTHEAFKVVSDTMRHAEKDTVRLAAALAVLKVAGMRFDSPPEESDVTPIPLRPYTKPQLMAAAKGEA